MAAPALRQTGEAGTVFQHAERSPLHAVIFMRLRWIQMALADATIFTCPARIRQLLAGRSLIPLFEHHINQMLPLPNRTAAGSTLH